MANPLVKQGIKLAVKGGKALRKKIKTARNSRNSTDNMTKGPIDKSIRTKKVGIEKNSSGMTREDMMPDINPNEYGYGTGGLYQAPPKSGKIKKIIKNVIDIDDPF